MLFEQGRGFGAQLHVRDLTAVKRLQTAQEEGIDTRRAQFLDPVYHGPQNPHHK